MQLLRPDRDEMSLLLNSTSSALRISSSLASSFTSPKSNFYLSSSFVLPPRRFPNSSLCSLRASLSFTTRATTANATTMGDQRRLMFEDECILVDESDNVVGHESKYNSTICNKGVRNAAQRKLFDELGIPAEDLPVGQFMPLSRILYKAPSDGEWGEHELDYLLFIVQDVNVHPNPDEVADAKYVNRDQLKELLRKADAGEEGLKLSSWFRLLVDNFLFKWWYHVEKGTLKDISDMETIHKLT